jgi:putative inorganic carbon (hco3(-)) transporter
VGVAALAAGTALGRSGGGVSLALAAVLAPLALIVAFAQLRWSLVALLFLLASYAPDALAGSSSAKALSAVVIGAALLRWGLGREQLLASGRRAVPVALAALALAYAVATLVAGDRAAAASETVDLLNFAALVVVLVAVLDSPAWLERAVWAVVGGIGLLAAFAVLQQITKTYDFTWLGFASVLDDGNALRSAGPLNPNPFGQVLAAAAVLAVYLGLVARRPAVRSLGWSLAVLCAVGVVYTQSRAALITLLLAALLIAFLRGARLRVLAAALCATLALGLLVLPDSLQQRVGALGDVVGGDAATYEDTALRGRASENVAGLEMWRDHPLLGVGPDNFELHYQRYSASIGLDPRPEARSAHNLVLESLAETGLIGALAFAAVLALALAGGWRARSRLTGKAALLGEGVFVALCAFLVCALTLSSAYARYQWIFVGLGLAAGRLARRADS